jgi:hypothetical protein
MRWVSFLKPSNERKRGEAFRTIKIVPPHTTEVCSLRGCSLAGSEGVLLLRALLVKASVGNVYFIHRQLLPLLVNTLCK